MLLAAALSAAATFLMATGAAMALKASIFTGILLCSVPEARAELALLVVIGDAADRKLLPI